MGEYYIVFSKTNTHIGRFIRFFTHNKFNHVSIATNENLNEMYSFARRKKNTPLAGGFVIECPARYLYDGKDTEIKVCKICLPDNEYKKTFNLLEHFKKHSDDFHYNSINAVISIWGGKINIYHCFTCIEFIAFLFDFNDIITLKSLEKYLKSNIIYIGSYNDYLKSKNVTVNFNPDDRYFEKSTHRQIIFDTCKHFSRLIKNINY